MNIKQKLKDYFEGVADMIQLEYKHSSTTGHPNDVGDNREDILINFFNKHLPHKFKAIRGGKIFDSEGNSSKQVDVVIYDNNIPRLASYQQTLYLAEGVATAIEIKPSLTKGEFIKAIENLKSIKLLKKKTGGSIMIGDFRKDIYCGIFSFETNLSFQDILNIINEKIGEEKIIDFIVVNNKYLILRNNGEWHIESETSREKINLTQHYLNFDDGKMILYRFFMLACKEIGVLKLSDNNGLDNYINMKFE
ncbi:MAG: hypothetical protein UR66_C0009G0063 [Candidatus Moranbacteria bacterium GW2011_GWE1_35_17]|nr:MAG: hypothetical protein UR66_C0009G0063 [Candidatus Moranbacteria bacterium GW2011_GWE1_35_17]KKP83130.1 MAG: hypothetical protein UR82_C0024G0008 [Candidatus Moranbacteria bacterium GW2011_GWF1_35_5]KKP83996.1 MAG: hypothetical protein UR83_C0029G0029 [Candidatus Moranbacteria bacterium GW2011_GWF2_35_54]